MECRRQDITIESLPQYKDTQVENMVKVEQLFAQGAYGSATDSAWHTEEGTGASDAWGPWDEQQHEPGSAIDSAWNTEEGTGAFDFGGS